MSNVSNTSDTYILRLKVINLGSWDFSQVSDANEMFVYCEKLEKIIANFNFKMIKEMAFMFCYCTKLSKVDLSHSDLSHVFDFGYTFFKCEGSGKRHWVLYNTEMYEVKETLTHDKYIHYKENSNLAPIIPINATSCLFMFRNCWRLESLDLSNFDTSQVTEMGGMFFWCVTLKSLNLSFFNTSK